jgi:hypothetical protein
MRGIFPDVIRRDCWDALERYLFLGRDANKDGLVVPIIITVLTYFND